MGLGNNRDYTTAERSIRRKFAVANARSLELQATGVEKMEANMMAWHELTDGKLNDQLKAWMDPILVHKRKMREERGK